MADSHLRVAIVGAGVSGLTVAHLLHRRHDITVFEAGSYAGGHTNTIASSAVRASSRQRSATAR